MKRKTTKFCISWPKETLEISRRLRNIAILLTERRIMSHSNLILPLSPLFLPDVTSHLKSARRRRVFSPAPASTTLEFVTVQSKHLRIFGRLRQCSESFGKCSETFVWPSEQFSEIFGKWSEIFGKSSKTASLARLNYTLARRYQFYVLVVRSLVKYSSCHSSMKFISSRPRVISSMTEQCPITD